MSTLKRNAYGYLTLIAIFLIVIFSILLQTLVYLFSTKTAMSAHMIAQSRALALADTAVQEGAYQLSQDITCSNLSNNKSMPFGLATTTKATSSHYTVNPLFASSTLSGSISSSVNSISVSNSTVFAPQGRVMIDREIIDYKHNSGSSLSILNRGVSHTRATSHSSGAVASQLLCSIQGDGASPSTPLSQRSIVKAAPLSMAYTVGDRYTFWQYNHPNNENAWRSMRSQTSSSNRYRAVSLLNYHEGFAVGDTTSGQLRIEHLHHGTWSSENSNVGNVNLYGVNMVSQNEAWAVGARSGSSMNIFRWDGSSWCRLQTSSSCGGRRYSTSASNNERTLYAVNVLAYNNTNGTGDFGFAVGGRSSDGLILIYNGSRWQDSVVNTNTIGQIYALSLIPNGNSQPIEAWTAGRRRSGNQGEIIRYYNGSWQISSRKITTRRMRAISMIDTNGDGLADFGFAVGDRSYVYTYSNGSWNNGQRNPGGAFGGNNITLYGVVVISPTNAWIVGGGGRTYHFDGNSWSQVSRPSGTSGRTLYDVDAIGPKAMETIGFRALSE